MYFYNEHKNGTRYIVGYDEGKHGEPRYFTDNMVILYNNSLIVSAVFDTVEEALKAWGRYSLKPVCMPD